MNGSHMLIVLLALNPLASVHCQSSWQSGDETNPESEAEAGDGDGEGDGKPAPRAERAEREERERTARPAASPQPEPQEQALTNPAPSSPASESPRPASEPRAHETAREIARAPRTSRPVKRKDPKPAPATPEPEPQTDDKGPGTQGSSERKDGAKSEPQPSSSEQDKDAGTDEEDLDLFAEAESDLDIIRKDEKDLGGKPGLAGINKIKMQDAAATLVVSNPAKHAQPLSIKLHVHGEASAFELKGAAQCKSLAPGQQCKVEVVNAGACSKPGNATLIIEQEGRKPVRIAVEGNKRCTPVNPKAPTLDAVKGENKVPAPTDHAPPRARGLHPPVRKSRP